MSSHSLIIKHTLRAFLRRVQLVEKPNLVKLKNKISTVKFIVYCPLRSVYQTFRLFLMNTTVVHHNTQISHVQVHYFHSYRSYSTKKKKCMICILYQNIYKF